MNYSITKYGKPLAKSLYTIDERTKTFSSNESYLVLDFSNEYGWTFHTGSNCTFNTGYGCTFKTGWNCTFKTGDDCTFNTGDGCTFHTGYRCTFSAGDGCTFSTGSFCTFSTGSFCTFKTGDDCTFSIHNNFTKLETKGNSALLIRDKKQHAYLEEEVTLYYEGEILYTDDKLSLDEYLMLMELKK